jgi:N-acetyl-anhydromuramyl-L-alanine amidase AmpD
MRFIQAKNFTQGRISSVKHIVLHTMEAPEKPKTAENVANWFAGKSAPKASAHYCVGADGVIQCVKDEDTAWHAPGANASGIGIEMVGYAAQNPNEWRDLYSTNTLLNVAALVVDLCDKHGIPLRKIDADDLKVGTAGICGHSDVSLAFGKSNHTDPGKGFPWDDFIATLRKRACG